MMKRFTFFSLVLVCTFVSCKKSNSSGYHVNATIGGKGKAFNFIEPVGLIEKTGQAITSLVITGILDTAAGEAIQIQLSCGTDKGIVPGAYVDTATDCVMQVIYSSDKDHEYYAGTTIAGWAESSNITLKNHLKIVITSIDDKSVKGTLGGDIFLDGDVSTTAVTMTNGDFYAQVDQ